MRVTAFGLGRDGKSKIITSKVLQNLYCEIRPDGEKSKIVAYGTPGLEEFVDLGASPCRAIRPIGDYMYVVNGNTFWEINNAGVANSRGTLLTSTGRVGITDNGVQIFIGDGPNGYTYTIASTSFAQVSDIGFPGADTCDFLDGYIIVNKPDSGRFYISSAYDGSVWDALDFENAESSPDNVVRVFVDHGEIILFGSVTTEFWGNTGSADFPYAQIRGATMEYGLAARWSATKFDGGVAFLAKNITGQVEVMKLRGYTPIAISTPDIDSIINGYSAVSDATAFSYMLGGHPLLQINFPTANESWLYDASTQIWSSLKSDTGRHRAEIHVDYLNKPYVSDYENGKIYKLRDDVYTDNGETIESLFITENIANEDMTPFDIGCVRLDIETGVGLSSGQGSKPQVMLQISRDGGRSYGSEIWRSAGELNEYLETVDWNRLGQARQWNFKFKITDPVKRVISGVIINPPD